MGSRIYVGNLSSRVAERDLEHFFKGFGRIKDVMMKSGFGFVEFDDSRDADDAIREQNGRELMGNRVVVELSRRKPESRYGYGRRDGGGGGHGGGGGGYRDDRGFRDGPMSRDGRVNGRFPPPMQTRFRMIVTNLSTRCSWQDIKDMMRMDGKVNVTYADAHKRARNEALLCFANHDDLRYAMDKFQGKEINGRRIKIVDDTEGDRSGGGRRGGRSRSRSGGSRSRSRSHSRSGGRRSRSRSARRSRSRSPPSRSRSRSASSKGSRVKNGGDDDRKARKRSPSRSASPASSRGGGSPKKNGMDD